MIKDIHSNGHFGGLFNFGIWKKVASASSVLKYIERKKIKAQYIGINDLLTKTVQ